MPLKDIWKTPFKERNLIPIERNNILHLQEGKLQSLLLNEQSPPEILVGIVFFVYDILMSPSFIYYFLVIDVKHQSVNRRTYHICNQCSLNVP